MLKCDMTSKTLLTTLFVIAVQPLCLALDDYDDMQSFSRAPGMIEIVVKNKRIRIDPQYHQRLDETADQSVVIVLPPTEDNNGELQIDDPEGYTIVIIIPEEEPDNNGELQIDDPEGREQIVVSVVIPRDDKGR